MKKVNILQFPKASGFHFAITLADDQTMLSNLITKETATAIDGKHLEQLY